MAIPILTAANLSRAGFSHAFSTRAGGVSAPPHASLDFAVLRDRDALRENQARLAASVGFSVDRLHQSMQVHGSAVLVAAGDPAATLAREADALVAEPKSEDAVAVRVADCVPVLFADPVSGRVAAVHAGWRGVEARIVAATIRHLAEASGAGERASFLAAIGPSIGPCCFEVGVDVGARIAAAADAGTIERTVGSKAFIDLRHAVRTQLCAGGLVDENVDDVPQRGAEGCTRCNEAQFYSYRRDGDRSGRLIAVIAAR